MTNAQTEARAIALEVFANAVDSDDDSHSMDMPVAIDIIATALAAKDADNARLDADLVKTSSLYIDAISERDEARRQLAGANKALEPFAKAVEDIDGNERDSSDIWEHPVALNITLGDLRAARRAREQGGE